ncbi:MAG: AAA family ATPase [Pseudomonadota bacterium]
MRYTTFADKFGNGLQENEADFEQLAELIKSATPAPSKSAAPLISLTTFNERRSSDTMKEVWGVEIDYDNETIAFEQAVTRLRQIGANAIVYTTPSHTTDNPRWRAILPFDTAGGFSDRDCACAALNGLFGGELAGESFSRSQPFYFGPVVDNPHYHVEVIRGRDVRQCVRGLPVIPQAHRLRHDATVSKSTPEDYENDIECGEMMHGAIIGLAGFGRTADQIRNQVADSAMQRDPDPKRVKRWQQLMHGREIERAVDYVKRRRDEAVAELSKSLSAPPGGINAPSETTELRTLGGGDFAAMSVTEREWIVPALIPKGETTLLYGPGGTGKSLLLLQLCLSFVTGQTWLDETVPQGRVLFMTCEDDPAEINRRSAGILAAYEKSWDDVGDRFTVLPMRINESSAVLASQERGGTLAPMKTYEALKRLTADTHYDLIIIDTLADVFAGNENDRGHAKQFIKLIEALGGGTYIVTAHPSVSGEADGRGASGSTGWPAAVRSHLYFKRKKDDYDSDYRELENLKSNYAKLGEGNLTVKYEGGVFVRVNSAAIEIDKTAEHELAFLKILSDKINAGFNVSGHNVAKPFSETDHAKSLRITKHQMNVAFERLVANGVVVNETYKSPKGDRQRLAIDDSSPLLPGDFKRGEKNN